MNPSGFAAWFEATLKASDRANFNRLLMLLKDGKVNRWETEDRAAVKEFIENAADDEDEGPAIG
jgi:hypothetical protein